MPKNITVYTTNSCSYCLMVKRYLDSKKLKYDVVNLDDQPGEVEKVYAMSGSLKVPIIKVTKADDTDEVVVGYNLARLAPAVA